MSLSYPVNVRLSKDDFEALKEISRRARLPVSDLVRFAVGQFIEKVRKDGVLKVEIDLSPDSEQSAAKKPDRT
ncbi:MAG: ribbon-helix-helix protein, CopG family [Verrucomicrobiae bacterium]|nr:ribbon-helix-helix protein, CopG family [Verrucomicrobiae bacterium]